MNLFNLRSSTEGFLYDAQQPKGPGEAAQQPKEPGEAAQQPKELGKEHITKGKEGIYGYINFVYRLKHAGCKNASYRFKSYNFILHGIFFHIEFGI